MSNKQYTKNKYIVKASKEDQAVIIDPYLVAKYSDVGDLGAPAFQMMKKLMRGKAKGHTEKQVLEELYACLDRWASLNEDFFLVKSPCLCAINKGPTCEECAEIETPVADLNNEITDGM